jgi:hypothetical protein
MAFRTLGALRADLLARLGMGAMGASGGANKSLIDSFLTEGQKLLYRMADWKHLQDYKDITTGIGQNLYDFPAAGTMDTTVGCAHYQRVLRVETNVSGQFVRIKDGITTDMWSTMDTRGQPQRFERFKQIMVYPKADTAYTLRVWFVSDLGRLTQEDDVCTTRRQHGLAARDRAMRRRTTGSRTPRLPGPARQPARAHPRPVVHNGRHRAAAAWAARSSASRRFSGGMPDAGNHLRRTSHVPGGLDRRLPVTVQDASRLWILRNAYITTGKRIKKRPRPEGDCHHL